MTPTAEWYEADADDSDRSITEDVTTSTRETARAATETGETGTRVHGDADLLRKRTAALDRVAAENERLRAEVERLTGHKAEWRDAAHTNKRQWLDAIARAEAAEAKLRDVEALADEWIGMGIVSIYESAQELGEIVRERLARSQAPQAPVEQEGPRLPPRPTVHDGTGPVDGVTRCCGVRMTDLLPIDRVTMFRSQVTCIIPAPSVRPATADDAFAYHGDGEVWMDRPEDDEEFCPNCRAGVLSYRASPEVRGPVMHHDDACELERNNGHGCNCGSRACPLCDGCRDGRHLAHEGGTCTCPACEEAA